jgi:hypothetical protein
MGTTSRTDNGVEKQVPCVMADLHMDEVSKKSPKGNLYDYVLSMSEKNNDMFGNSIVYHPDEEEKIMEKDTETGEESAVYYQRLKALPASDLVDSPAATSSLFRDETDFAAVATNFLDENPGIYDVLDQHPDLFMSFMEKYNEHSSNKSKMKNQKSKSLWEKAKELIRNITGKEMIQIDSTDGKKFNVDCANGTEPAQGDPVTDEAGAQAVNATINAADGRTITTDANGLITEVKPAPDSQATPPPADQTNQNETDPETLESLSQKNQQLAAQLKESNDLNAALKNQLKESEHELSEIQNAFEKTNEQLEFIAKHQRSDTSLKDGRQNFNHEKHEKVKPSKEEKKEQIKAGVDGIKATPGIG